MRKYIFLLFSVLVSSCSTLNSMYIDQLAPSDVSYPANIGKIGIINNTDPNVEYTDKEDMSQKNMSSKIIVPDGKQWAENFASNMADVNYFDEVILCDSAINNTMSEHVFSGEEANSLMQNLNVDMLVSLDQSVGLFRYHANQTLPYSYISGQAIVYSIVRLYLPDRSRPYHTFIDKDTLIWENDLSLNNETLKKEITDYVSELPLKHLAPQWKKTERYYFSGRNVNLRDAAVFVRENNWNKAVNLWKQSYENSKGKAKFESAFNMAFGCEMLGNFDEALSWIGRAESLGGLSNAELLKYYKTILEKRATDAILINVQMSRFNMKN